MIGKLLGRTQVAPVRYAHLARDSIRTAAGITGSISGNLSGDDIANPQSQRPASDSQKSESTLSLTD